MELSPYPLPGSGPSTATPARSRRGRSVLLPEFLYCLSYFGSLPEKPHMSMTRIFKRKPFRRPDISAPLQEFLEGQERDAGLVVDVGANVAMTTFTASAMGFRVVVIEPVFKNQQKICNGVFLNRAGDRETVYAVATSNRIGNITFDKILHLWRLLVCSPGPVSGWRVHGGLDLAFQSTQSPWTPELQSFPWRQSPPATAPLLKGEAGAMVLWNDGVNGGVAEEQVIWFEARRAEGACLSHNAGFVKEIGVTLSLSISCCLSSSYV
ncbi:hypothetical protein ZIOFF_029159 [Zingiber officinale]|uniref:Uncharacterized protein n=1 Tax=Zingiber officinale TaxID=94328 RepID=A0A8J5LAD5_ZINOF|nr:hypothetical protein ZIOFF_029159 [Zingiber officinale]